MAYVTLNCPWNYYVAVCETARPLVSLSISTTANQAADLIVKNSVQKSLNIVVCISPLFLYERWQMLVTAIGIWRHYGANEVVVYYLSALETVYRLMKAYESSGLIRLESFPSLPSFDDNVHLFEKIEWRNQPSAYLDCLYSYRESAQYIIFADPDDVLVPKLGQTYLSEFEQLFERWPDASGFLYNRLDLEVYHDSIGKPIGEFRLDELLQNYKPRNCAPTSATKYAAIPSRIIGAWIHNSGRIVGDFVDHKISCEENSFLHFRTWFESSAQNQGTFLLLRASNLGKKVLTQFAQ
uniref:Glycosyltransferase family 92 protein n=1 Tax=Plectus sambesii TaxID=2011161 RepID=A0A914XC49_9BILA